MKRGIGKQSLTLTLESRLGERRRIRITAPRRFFGVWTVAQLKPRRVARARVGCLNGRITLKWNTGARDRETQTFMIFAVNRAIAMLPNKVTAAARGVCRMR